MVGAVIRRGGIAVGVDPSVSYLAIHDLSKNDDLGKVVASPSFFLPQQLKKGYCSDFFEDAVLFSFPCGGAQRLFSTMTSLIRCSKWNTGSTSHGKYRDGVLPGTYQLWLDKVETKNDSAGWSGQWAEGCLSETSQWPVNSCVPPFERFLKLSWPFFDLCQGQ
mmetsp:Transcript_89247/g.154598  ORF Transcript_89247/g.154598 Transcript_89247/m.154598 type:complete len:163 (-) Transcript_89247:30-518(-)